MNTLLDCQDRQLFKARNGAHGMGKDMHGRSAEDLIISVPVGTIVKNGETGETIGDLATDGSALMLAKGGRGGRGNASFASSSNRAPRKFQEGETGEEKVLLLELKLIADVGLVGLPNSGKSTLISRVSNARPKIADYPFTTKVPGLGVVRVNERTDFVMADIPGLIKNAAKGMGMGDKFLRHIERTRILLHLIDPSPALTPSPEERFAIIMAELTSYSAGLVDKPMIAVITKMDLPENHEPAAKMEAFLRDSGVPVYKVSAVAGFGILELLRATAKALTKLRNSK